jgi:hypothetical protein
MNAGYIQNLRYKLQKRVRRLNSIANYEMFHASIKQFWGFTKENPVLMGIIDDLERRSPESEEYANRIINESEGFSCNTELENAAISYFVIRKCAESDDINIEVSIGNIYTSGDYREMIEGFRDYFLEPFYEYLDEQLDDQRAILSLLRRYKHKCEWFQREQLYKLWEQNTARGEKLLALHLFEYLHDQGLDFTIEPSSASGEVDLIADQKSEDPLIADTKIFNPASKKGKEYIVKGFNQIYLYTVDYDEPFGYLIIYKTSDKDLRFTLADQEQLTPFVVHNNKTIFVVIIDIYPHATSASKRGTLSPVEITENDLIQVVDSAEP